MIEIHCSPTTPIQIDGEVRHESLNRISYQVLPAKLDILAP